MKRAIGCALACVLGFILLGQTAWAGDGTLFTTSYATLSLDVSAEPRVQETLLGDHCADAIRNVTDADVALLPGALLMTGIPKGRVGKAQLEEVFSVDAEILIARVSPAQLKAILEAAVADIVTGEDERIDALASAGDRFLQVSGLCFCYDASAQVGERVKQITLLDGKELDMESDAPSLMVAFPDIMKQLEEVPERRSSEICLGQSLWDYVQMQGGIQPPAGDRIRVIGNNPSLFDEYLSVPLLLGMILLFALIRFLFPKRFHFDDGLPE